MHRLTGALITAVLVAGALVAGCGGGDSSTSSAAAGTNAGPISASEIEGTHIAQRTIPKATFVKRANAICAANVKTIKEKYARDIGASKNVRGYNQRLEEVDLTATVLAYELRKEQHELQELGAPSGEEEQVEAIIKADDKALDRVELNPERTIREKRPFAKLEVLTDEYGLTNCPYG